MSLLLLNSGGGDDLLLNTGDHLLLSGDQDLRWKPQFPDRIPPLRRLQTSLQQFFTINLSPIVNPPPPVPLVWQGSYPTQMGRSILPRAATPSYTSGYPFLGTELRAWPVYSNPLPRPRLRQYVQTFEISGVIDVPKRGGWRPVYPSWLDRKLPTRTGTSVWIVDPTTLLNAAHCVEWTAETCTLPAFTEEVRLSPDFASETATLPAMTEEDLC